MGQLVFEGDLLAGQYRGHPVTQLAHQGVGDIVDAEGVFRRVLGDAGVEQDLQQYVAEFVAHFLGVAAADRVEEFVGFLQQVAMQRVVGLFAFPRSRRPQPVHDFDRVDQTLTGAAIGDDQPLAGRQSGLDGRVLGV